MSKVIQCDFCKEIFEKYNGECIELYKKDCSKGVLGIDKHICPTCYEKFIEGKIEKVENTKSFKDKLIDFLVEHEVCDCCACDCVFDSNDEKKCKAGIREWVESEVEE